VNHGAAEQDSRMVTTLDGALIMIKQTRATQNTRSEKGGLKISANTHPDEPAA
jgi:hypothetical protein